MRISLLLLLVLSTAGCATGPVMMPESPHRPAATCQWDYDGEDDTYMVRRVVSALEADGFTIVDTEVALGLTSAEKRRSMPAYRDLYAPRSSIGWFGGGGRGRFASGFSMGFQHYVGPDPQRVERISVLTTNGRGRISRMILIIDADGRVRDSSNASDDAFCRTFRDTLERQPARVEGAS
ncbi:hypothetical protein [Aidingimonas halophila]|uniref:DUF4136 domain-containing protein n=1 Tax=Aidingimonas halophila TaxID=574349 RepID=A0A1H2Z4A2_9GAMM|nr:hypothetical protein [Aidingimonas halophila]GHC15341.1 hypothetical protein GCM10008094_00330 [Aidingimonas halophila]SDX12262.1 hypothetical protein SAMN05443545_10437 [Aidingimonas halophila]